MSILALVACLALFQLPVADHVVLIHTDVTTKKRPMLLHSHSASGTATNFVGGIDASNTHVGRANGKHRIVAVLAADRDGDDVDELVVVRTRKNKPGAPLELRVHRMPTKIGDPLRTPLASAKQDVGIVSGDGAAIRFCAADLDGDGIDELLVVRAFDDGRRSLEVRRLPAVRNGRLGAPLHVVPQVGTAGVDDPISLCGLERVGPYPDEIAVLRRGAAGDRVVLHDPFVDDGSGIGAPWTSYIDVTASDGEVNESISGLRFAEPSSGWMQPPACLLFHRRRSDGTSRLDVFPAPVSADQTLGAPLMSDATPGIAMAQAPVFAAIGAKVAVQHPQNGEFEGSWLLSMFRAPPFTSAYIGPDVDLEPVIVSATLAGDAVIFHVASGETFRGTPAVTDFPNGSVVFDAATFPHPDDPTHDTVTVHFGTADLDRSEFDDQLRIHGDCGGDCGAEFDAAQQQIGVLVRFELSKLPGPAQAH